MESYKEMYLKLLRAQNKAIEILQQAHREAEEIFIEQPEIGEAAKTEE